MDTKESFHFLHSSALVSLSLLWSSHSLMYFSQHVLTSRVLGGDLREKRWQHFPERLQSLNFLGETPEKYLQLTFGCFFQVLFCNFKYLLLCLLFLFEKIWKFYLLRASKVAMKIISITMHRLWECRYISTYDLEYQIV